MLNYNKVANDTKCLNIVTNLFCRWLDEHEYEDINDYVPHIVKAVKDANGAPLEMTDIKPCKRPFGIKFTTPCDGKRWQLKRTMTTWGIIRIG